jgi:trk system potassium uptake protein TrkH
MKRSNLMSKALLFEKRMHRLSPAQMIIISFIIVIVFGAFLLYLPISHNAGVYVSVQDAFFTATSAVCVTGLTTLTTAATWSIFGKIIILCLIQIGGLSLITILAYFAIHLGKKVTLKERLTMQAAFNNANLNGMVRMVIMVIRGTLICEGVGTIILFLFFLTKDMPWYQALFFGLFHAVSAFCNAGFDLIGEQSLMPFSTNILSNFVFMILIIIGGIGFTVWGDVIQNIKTRVMSGVRHKKKMIFSLHSKLAIFTTLILLFLGTVYFIIAEYDNPATLGNLDWPNKIMASVFQSVTLRTAGFSSISQSGLKEVSKLVSSVFMLIGGSPGGTAGGIKTVTIAIIFCSVWSVIKDYYSITAFGRTLSTKTLQKALAIITMMLLLWIGATALLSFTEHNMPVSHTFIDLMYETASALGTVGLTAGITPFLSSAGKLLIMICMFVGRIGPITIVISLASRINHGNTLIRYPEEDIMIG